MNSTAVSQIFKGFKELKTYEKIIVLLVLLFFITIAVLRTIHIRSESDFYVFWSAGRKFYTGKQLYFWPIVDLQFLYPPFAAFIFGIIAIFPFKLGAILFSVTNILLWILNIYYTKVILEKLLNIRINKYQLFFTFIFTINFYLATVNLVQVNFFLYFITLNFLYQYIKKNYVWAGFFLAMSIAFKVTPVVFLGLLFLRGNIKSFIYSIAFLLIFFAIPIHVRGFSVGINDLKLFYKTLSDIIPATDLAEYSGSRSLRTLLSNYFIHSTVITGQLKANIINLTPLIFGFTYVVCLALLRLLRKPFSVFEIAATYVVILICSSVTSDAHMVTLAFAMMLLFTIFWNREKNLPRWFMLLIGIVFISPIGRPLSNFLLYRVNIYTLNMILIFVILMVMSFRQKSVDKNKSLQLN